MRDAMEVDHGCCVTDLDDVVVLRELRGGASARRKHRHDKECRGSGDGDAGEGVLRLMTERSDRFRALVHRPRWQTFGERPQPRRT